MEQPYALRSRRAGATSESMNYVPRKVLQRHSTRSKATESPVPNVPVMNIAKEQKTIRLELVDYRRYQESEVRPTVTYVDTYMLEEDASGTSYCRLSDILPKAAELNSPLKDPNVRLWRFDHQHRMPLILGPADTVSNPLTNRKCLFERPIVDRHRLRTEVLEGGFKIHSGVSILVETLSKPSSTPPPAADPGPSQNPNPSSDSLDVFTNGITPIIGQEVTGVPGPLVLSGYPLVVDTHRDPATLRAHKVTWLQNSFRLDPNALPGKILCTTARQALDRHKLILAVKDKVRVQWHGMIPQGAPQPILGARILQDELTEAFGFTSSTWFALHRRWDAHSKTGILGAQHVIAWSMDPDACIPGSNPPRMKYYHLNHVSLNALNSIIALDRQGGYHIDKNVEEITGLDDDTLESPM